MKNNYSENWKKRGDRTGLIRNALLKSMGYTDTDIEKPIIGIINTWAETNPGHIHFRQLSEAVKRGVWASGGFPLEVNTMSICEVFFDISSLVYRNLLSITTEELIERHPFDGIVLIGGCDKNIPAQLMAAVSANKPTIYLPGGAMLPGSYKGKTLACGTDSFYLYNDYTSGKISLEEMTKHEGCLYGSAGACPIMGTANTCQTVTEALGIALPNSASCLGVSAEKLRISEETGRKAVKLVNKNIKCLDIINEKSVENAIRVLMATGGSTNLIIHLIAIARRANIDLTLDDFERISKETPVLVNVKPHGTENVGMGFHNAGGVASLMKEMEHMLNGECLTVSGKTVSENLKEIDMPYDKNTIRPLDNPIEEKGGIAVLYGNLAPNGAVIKRSAASTRLLKHRGPAKVFENLTECQKYLLDENSDITPDTVIVLRGYGPKGAPGMPENGNFMPLPPKLNKMGINDFVRITDARMSGGCFGTQILHVAPESAVGGPLAAVRDGDIIHLDVDNNLIELEVSDSKITERLKSFKPKAHSDIKRGFVRNFIDNVTQADEGCDLTYMQYKG
ncbi:MAG: dihydroxy-acid dehydratase [Clostridiales bacterium]|jgi:dihydroxy-acid dehydratase|nr:dihydroxy-acid dehydratase [Clostridiales bacterium]